MTEPAETTSGPPDRDDPKAPAVPPEVIRGLKLGHVAIGPPPNAFIEKLLPDHITSIISHTASDKQRNAYITLSLAILGVVGFFAVCWLFLFYQKDAMLDGVLKLFAGFVGGFGGGFAAGRWKSKR